jgi:hypothetical protein
MQARNSETRFYVARVAPCVSASADEPIHGFMLSDGVREGMYIAELRTSGAVRWLDLAVSAGGGRGTIALRAWVDVETRLIRSRVVMSIEVEDHPARTLGGWLNKVEISALALDIDALTSQVVLGDDRLVAHLCDVPAAQAPTALAPPLAPKSAPRGPRVARVVRPAPAEGLRVATPAGGLRVATPAGGLRVATPAGGLRVATPAGQVSPMSPPAAPRAAAG